MNLYMDVHMPKAITLGLRARGVDVLTSHDDGTTELSDLELLRRASVLGRVLVSMDSDFFRETAFLQRRGEGFTGVICIRMRRLSIGRCIEELELAAKAGQPDDFANHIVRISVP